MSLLRGLFGPPNINKLEAQRDVRGLVKAFIKAFKSQSWQLEWREVRQAAAEALVRIGQPAVKPLVVVLKDSDKNVRQAAAEALTKLGVPDDTNTRAWHAVAMQDWNTAIALGAAALEPLVAVLKESDEYIWPQDKDVRRAVVAALGQIGDARAVKLLVAMLKNSKYRGVRWEVAKALGQTGDARAVKPLVAVLEDSKYSDVRLPAAAALGQIGDARAVKPLVAMLKDSDKNVRRTAAKALGNIGDARAIGPLIAGLKDPSARLDESATQALAILYQNGNLDERSRLQMLTQEWQRLAWHIDDNTGSHGDGWDEHVDHQDGMTYWESGSHNHHDYPCHSDQIEK